MEMKWSPQIIGGLFCDRKDHMGLYYWWDVLQEKKKFKKLKPGQQLKMTYDVIDG